VGLGVDADDQLAAGLHLGTLGRLRTTGVVAVVGAAAGAGQEGEAEEDRGPGQGRTAQVGRAHGWIPSIRSGDVARSQSNRRSDTKLEPSTRSGPLVPHGWHRSWRVGLWDRVLQPAAPPRAWERRCEEPPGSWG